jgi:glycosyltransferase involved in cell wall biosynthesis
MTDEPRVSIVIPAYNEGDEINYCLDRIVEGVTLPFEVLVVCDMEGDTTLPFLRARAAQDPRIVSLLNGLGRGPATAIRHGFSKARADVVVVTMADGSDDPQQIDPMTRLVERGVVIAAASRYMRGGQQVGGPWLKGRVSRAAGRSLQFLARVGTHDATNSFKAYSRAFVEQVGIESDAGFEIGIELVAKARRLGMPVAELPTIWLDRSFGTSNFQMSAWIGRYLKWYLYALRPRRQRPRGAVRLTNKRDS